VVFYLSIQPYFYSYLLVVHNQSVSSAGRIVQTFSFTATIANIVNSLLIQRIGRYKPFLVAGGAVYLLATLVMLRFRTQEASVPLLVAAQAALGIGASLQHLPAQLAVQSCVATHQQVGAATAVFMTLVEVGGAVGAAISGAVWSGLVPAKLEKYLPPEVRGDAHDIYASVVKACSYEWGSPERDAINRSYQETMTTLLTVAVCMCVPLLFLSLMVKDTRLDSVDQHVRGRVIGGDVGGGRKKSDWEGWRMWRPRWKRNATTPDHRVVRGSGESSGLLIGHED
jgi:MFS family permease